MEESHFMCMYGRYAKISMTLAYLFDCLIIIIIIEK